MYLCNYIETSKLSRVIAVAEGIAVCGSEEVLLARLVIEDLVSA